MIKNVLIIWLKLNFDQHLFLRSVLPVGILGKLSKKCPQLSSTTSIVQSLFKRSPLTIAKAHILHKSNKKKDTRAELESVSFFFFVWNCN